MELRSLHQGKSLCTITTRDLGCLAPIAPRATPKTSAWVGWLQAGLDIAGLVPVIGEFADLANAGIYLAQGDYQLAGLSAISIIPVFGDAIGKSSKVVVKATRYMDEAAEATQQVAKKIDLPVLGCFEGGTPVHIASLAPVPWDLALCTVANEAASEYEWLYGEDQNDGRLYESTRSTQSIEEVTLGSRTVGQNPNRDDYDLVFGLPDENTWRQVHMQLDRGDGVVVDIQLLRPIDWIEASGLFVGGEYDVDLPHTSARGIARVLDIAPCPMLANGDGNLVIGRFETRDAKELLKVTFEDGTTLTGTRIHPVWSLDREDWIELGKLEVGENLQGSNGPVAVQCMSFIATSQPVYNLEIFGEHVYRVGDAGVLCHNTDPTTCTYIFRPKTKGGAHGNTKLPWRDGFESHHMPAKSVTGLDPDVGPAIQMERIDHILTSSHGSRSGSAAYRSQIEDLLRQGKTRESMAIEINDVRRAALEASGDLIKYNGAIKEMLEYARGIDFIP